MNRVFFHNSFAGFWDLKFNGIYVLWQISLGDNPFFGIPADSN